MAEYKKIPQSLEQDYNRMQHYAFLPEKGPDYSYKLDAPRIGERRGMFDRGKPVTVGCFFPIETRIRGELKPLGGITEIATPPEQRRKGLVKSLLFNLLEELKDSGIYLSALWAASFPLYRRFGFSLVTELTHYTMPIRLLNFPNTPRPDNFREFTLDDFPATESLYHEFVSNYNLPLKRNPEWWKAFVLKQTQLSAGSPAFSYVLEEDGKIKGYILYSLLPDPYQKGLREFHVRELVCSDDASYLQLLNFIFNHAIQAEKVYLYASLDDLLLDRVSEPESVRKEKTPGAMVRIVDVQQALESFPVDEKLKGRVTLKVDDSFLPWNKGNFTLEIEEGQIEVSPGESSDADAQIDINSLAQMYTGYLKPPTAIKLDRLRVISQEKLDLLNNLFPLYRTYLKDYF